MRFPNWPRWVRRCYAATFAVAVHAAAIVGAIFGGIRRRKG